MTSRVKHFLYLSNFFAGRKPRFEQTTQRLEKSALEKEIPASRNKLHVQQATFASVQIFDAKLDKGVSNPGKYGQEQFRS